MRALVDVLLEKIFLFVLSPARLNVCQLVCSEWRRVLSSFLLWKRVAVRLSKIKPPDMWPHLLLRIYYPHGASRHQFAVLLPLEYGGYNLRCRVPLPRGLREAMARMESITGQLPYAEEIDEEEQDAVDHWWTFEAEDNVIGTVTPIRFAIDLVNIHEELFNVVSSDDDSDCREVRVRDNQITLRSRLAFGLPETLGPDAPLADHERNGRWPNIAIRMISTPNRLYVEVDGEGGICQAHCESLGDLFVERGATDTQGKNPTLTSSMLSVG